MKRTIILFLILIGAASGQDTLSTLPTDSSVFDQAVELVSKTFDYLNEQNPDVLFEWAREAAIESGNHELAISICQQGLELAPDYLDIRLLLGRLYAWGGQYDSAEVHLRMVVGEAPEYHDARLALSDALIWSNKYELALPVLWVGLDKDPENVDFLVRYATCLKELGKAQELKKTIATILKLDPNNERALAFQDEQIPDKRSKKLSITYTLNRLADTKTQWQMLVGETTLDPWHLFSIEYEQSFSFGPVISRFNQADRYGRTGSQLEVESYPLLREGTYAYLGLGYSWTDLFPQVRTGAEIFQALPSAHEVSVGYRSLHFEAKDLYVLSLSTSKYIGNYWISARAFLSQTEGSLSQAINLQTRKYFSDPGNFVELSIGQGETPGVGIGEDEVNYLGSRHLGLSGQWKLDELNMIKGNITLANVEIREEAYRGDTGIMLSYSRLF